jgi:prephenate dehydrogenase
VTNVCIAGLGLIGGSIGIALRARGWRVAYVDPHVSLDEALARGAADERLVRLEGDLVVIATPVDVAIELVRNASGLTTTVCSVMAPLRDVARAPFVAGHPVAGSQERGLAAASGDLFQRKPWFVDAGNDLVEAMIRDCGAHLERVDAREHDEAVALTSHLPQVLSTALGAYLADRDDLVRFAGTGLKTFLRLAGSDASVWAPVLDANRANLAPHADALAKVVRSIIDGDAAAFEKAQRFWRSLSS